MAVDYLLYDYGSQWHAMMQCNKSMRELSPANGSVELV